MIKVERFKRWFQVKQNGMTIFQSLNENEAQAFAMTCTKFGAADAHLGEQGVTRRFGTTTKRVSIYP